jgi:aminomethyltransferase
MGKRTPLYEEHVRLGATIVPFAGWDMPVYYTTVMDEHAATRGHAGLFDTSHMGEIEVSGPDSVAYLQHLLSNDMNKLEPGKALYSVLPNECGGCVDDLTVYMFGKDTYCLVVNASTTDKDFAWLMKQADGYNVKIVNRSESTGMLALQGPAMKEIMAGADAVELPGRFRFREMEVAGVKALVSRTGYTGEDGVELYHDAKDTMHLWNALLDVGGPLGVKPVGLGARDTLRLEVCYSLYGHELSDDISPIEACISFAVAKDKPFIGSEVIHAQMRDGVARKLAAFELTERGVPRDGYPVFVGDENAGVVTSGCFSPTLKKGIGLAMLRTQHIEIGREIAVEIRGKKYAGRIVKRPFVTTGGGK